MKKVIVIGGGPAGLTAAYELLKTGNYSVIVLEATDRLGGISQTVRYKDNRMDIGGHRFFSKDSRVTDWWQEILPVQGFPAKDDLCFSKEKEFSICGPDPETDDQVMLIRDRVSRIYYKNAFFDYPISLKWDTLKNMGFATTIKAGFSYLKSVMFKRPEKSLEDFYINRFGKVLYSMFFEGYTEKLWGRHPSEISASWGAQRVKGLSVTAVIKDVFSKLSGKKQKNTETSLIERFWYPKFGPGQLWETVAERIVNLGGEISLDTTVTEIHVTDNTVTAVKGIKNNEPFTLGCDIVISTMPIKDLIAGMTNEVPLDIKSAAEGLPYRDFMTVGLLLKKLKIQNQTDIKTFGNIVPDCWIYVQDTSVKLGRIQVFNNWSPYLVSDPQNTVWVGLEYFCREGDEIWNLSDSDAVKLAISELEKIGVIDSFDVLDSHRELVKKAYPAYFDTYCEIDKITNYLDTFSNLYCIGRNGQHRYNNMDHSMVTAFECVKAIKENSADRSAIWNVNTEKEYHEEK
jgi:protoporphyrinogen oxidase